MTTHTDFARPVDRTLHDGPLPIGFAAVPAPLPAAPALPSVDTSIVPPSLALHARQTTVVPADAPLPGTVTATTYDPWRPLQHFPSPAPDAPPRAPDSPDGRGALDVGLTAAQFATVAASRGKLDRARSYAKRLDSHAAEIRAKLQADAEHNVMAAIGRTEMRGVDVEALRGEMVETDRQHRQALAALADIEAEHARHEADLSALIGSDGTARTKLAEAHVARTAAQTAAEAARAILDRAMSHRDTVARKLASARADEARHDADATARLRAALSDGDAPPAAAEPLSRISGALEDDLRAATTAVDSLAAEHTGKVAALADAHRAVLEAVDGVLVVDAEQVARELHAADDRALALRTRLHCFAKRTAADYVAPQPKPAILLPSGVYEPHPETARAAIMGAPPIRQTAIIGATIASAPMPPHQGPFASNWSTEHAAWDAYATALAADPQAEPLFADRPATSPAPLLPGLTG